MSITGEPDGEPMKVGVGIADVMCGMYAAVAILAALRHRDATGEGQHIDMALLDTQVAWLVNEGMNYLLSGRVPTRLGNEHPNIVPYKLFGARTGRCCWPSATICSGSAGAASPGPRTWPPTRASRPTRPRVRNRQGSTRRCPPTWGARPRPSGSKGWPLWVCRAARSTTRPGVRRRAGPGARPPPGPAAPAGRRGTVPTIANPIRMTATPPSYRSAPPTLGQHTREVLGELLGFDGAALSAWPRTG